MAKNKKYRIDYMKAWIRDHPELYSKIIQTHYYKKHELENVGSKSAIETWKNVPNWGWEYYDNDESYKEKSMLMHINL